MTPAYSLKFLRVQGSYRNPVSFHGGEHLLALSKPSLRFKLVGVMAEDVLVPVNNPGVCSHDTLDMEISSIL